MNNRLQFRLVLAIVFGLVIIVGSTHQRADSGTCGGVTINLPFTDVPGTNVFFCSIAEAFFSGLTNGTTPTTFSPSANVPREQMAAFISRTLDQSLKRGSRRAALKEFWTPKNPDALGVTIVGLNPGQVACDGADLWVVNQGGPGNPGTVSRVRASDGKLLETWTGAATGFGVLSAKGLIFVTGFSSPGKLYQIDPSQPAGPVTTLPVTLGDFSSGIAFDGGRIWSANSGGSVSIITLNPLGATTVSGFASPRGILFDGDNIWITDRSTSSLHKLDSNGAVLQTVTVMDTPSNPVFDGTNIWVPNSFSNTISVVRASTGEIIATLSGNGMDTPDTASFDGERILVTNQNNGSVSVWKASDLTPLGSLSIGASTIPTGSCSDGLNFWITLQLTGKLVRF